MFVKEKKDKYHLVITIFCLCCFILNFWLFYPGYLSGDWVDVLQTLPLDNWHPVIYPFILRKLSDIFGYHIYYSLLFNLIPFYFGIYFIISGLYKKFQSKLCLLGALPILIGNIFFQNIILHSSFSSPMLIFLLWSIVLYQILVGINYKNSVILFGSFIFATLSRHNAIFQIYPIFFIYSYLIVQKLQISTLLRKFCIYVGLLLSAAFFSLLIALFIPKLIQNTVRYPATHIFLHQIAGACVVNHDANCFRPEWYKKGKTYTDLETTYYMYPIYADKMIAFPDSPMVGGNLEGISISWLKSILKYPKSYLVHISRFIAIMWNQSPLLMNVSLTTENHSLNPVLVDKLINKYPSNELFYQSSKIKISLYNFLKKLFFNIPTIIFVFLNYIVFIISGILFLRKKDTLLLYSLSSSIAGIAGSVIFCIFSPVTDSRYIYPVLINSLFSVIGLNLYLSVKQAYQRIDIKKAIFLISLCLSILGLYAYIHRPLTARVDIYAPYTNDPLFFVYNYKQNSRTPLTETLWMQKNGKRGYVIQNSGRGMTLTVIALENVDININFRGPEEKSIDNKRIENWVKYTDFRVNGEKILSEPVDTWHDKPFKYTLKAEKGKVYKIKLQWRKK